MTRKFTHGSPRRQTTTFLAKLLLAGGVLEEVVANWALRVGDVRIGDRKHLKVFCSQTFGRLSTAKGDEIGEIAGSGELAFPIAIAPDAYEPALRAVSEDLEIYEGQFFPSFCTPHSPQA